MLSPRNIQHNCRRSSTLLSPPRQESLRPNLGTPLLRRRNQHAGQTQHHHATQPAPALRPCNPPHHCTTHYCLVHAHDLATPHRQDAVRGSRACNGYKRAARRERKTANACSAVALGASPTFNIAVPPLHPGHCDSRQKHTKTDCVTNPNLPSNTRVNNAIHAQVMHHSQNGSPGRALTSPATLERT
jgi:hypothetical protein